MQISTNICHQRVQISSEVGVFMSSFQHARPIFNAAGKIFFEKNCHPEKSKTFRHPKIAVIVCYYPKIWTMCCLYHTVMCPKYAAGLASSLDPDPLFLQEQSDLGLHCLPRPVCPNTSYHHGNNNMSLVTRKPVFGVFDQVRLKPDFSAAETS